MGKLAEAGREFWGGVLVAGGFTAIPRWAADPVPGVAEHETPIADHLVVGLRRVAQEMAVPISSVLLAAHAKVLAALSDEEEVVTGYVAVASGRPVPCRLTTEAESWLAFVREARHTESGVLSHRGFPVDDLRRELGMAGPSFETVLDPTGSGGDLAEDSVLCVEIARRAGRWALRLRFRTEVLDAEAAARIAGYHLTALGLIVADPDAEHARTSLLSAEERELQLEGLAGPLRELPTGGFTSCSSSG